MAKQVQSGLKSTLAYAMADDEHHIHILSISSGSGDDSLFCIVFPRLKHPSCLEAFGARICHLHGGTAPTGFIHGAS